VGTVIDAVAVAEGHGRRGRSAHRLADAAARLALERAGLAAPELDLLVNAGLYHDRVMGEPALAALIQEDIGANPEDPHLGGHGTFSFDVADGACGMLTALQIADGFLRAGTIRHALVVASDADPGHGIAPGFPFAPAGAALVCSWRDGPGGIAGFHFADPAPEPASDGDAFGGGLRATIAFDDRRNRLVVEEEPDFDARAARWAARAASDLLDELGQRADDVDLVIANPLTDAFLTSLATELGVAGERVSRASSPRVHTAGLGFALDAAGNGPGPVLAGRTALLVSAGSGPTVGAALLRP
jgi:3-oxoacyl-[acyl-carrier-protein] synthase-3